MPMTWKTLLLAVSANALVLGIFWSAEYAKRWCPAGTDPEAHPHCLLQPYAAFWGARVYRPTKLPPQPQRAWPVLLDASTPR
jgi:hypothetical protein